MDAAMWRLDGPVRGAVARTSLLGLAVVGGYAAQGLSLAFALDAVLRRAPWSVASAWLGAFAAAMALRAAFIWLAEMAAQDTAQRAKEHLRGRLLRQLVALGPGYAVGQPTGALQAVVVNGVEALEAYYSRYLPAVFVAVSGCLAVLACLAWMDWRSALLLGAFAAAQPLVDHLWLRWRMPRNAGVFAAMGSFAAALLDSLQGIATLKAFGASQRWRERLAARAAALRRESMTDLYATLMRTGLTGLVMLGGIAAVLAFNAGRVARGELAPAALFLSLFLAREVFRPLERLEKAFHSAWAAAGAAAPMRQLLDAEPPVREARQPRPMPSRFDIAFDDVGFTYPGSTAPALAEVSLTLRECEFVALVGPSGAGKSTLGALLLRLFDPQAGAVRIGGVDARELPLEALRAMISVVAQDTVLFHGSIGDNLRMANPAATPDEIRAAAASAQIDDFIMCLPQGYATPVGENGAQLSGGQRQRIAIARALLKQSPILLLDEPTSNVDPASDRAIQATLRRLAGRRTLIVIAHRLATIRQADRIVVMDRGRVLEAGRHESLLRQPQGAYARLLSAQTALENPQEALA